MSLFWFLSIPGKSSPRDSFNELSNIVGGADLKAGQSMSEVELPDLKFGNLDALMLLSDELVKLDQLYEQLVNKLIETLKSTLQNDPDTLHASLLVNNKEFDDYIKTFSWNSMKYRTDKSLREVTDMIIQEMTTLDSTLKTKSTQYTAIKNSLTSLNRKQNGNLSVRNLNDIVQKEHCIQDSEYLTTVFVAVPKNNYDDWEKSYERLSDMVVPRSAKKIAEDNDYGLFSVHLFKRVVESFSTTCRDNKFIVRDFQYSETQMEEERKELDRVATTEQDLWKSLVQWCQTSFSDAVSCLIHIKVIRVINESVLRYGLPSNYVASIVKVHQEPKLTKALLDNYGHLGGSKSGKGNEDKGNDEGDFGAAFAEDNDYVPYVRFAYTWNGELQSQQ